MNAFPMPVLIDVVTARRTSDEHRLDLEITVENHRGNPEPETFWYTWDSREEILPDGRVYDLGLSIGEWFKTHPKFKIAPYVAPPPEPEPTPEEKFDRWVESSRLTKEQIKALLK